MKALYVLGGKAEDEQEKAALWIGFFQGRSPLRNRPLWKACS